MWNCSKSFAMSWRIGSQTCLPALFGFKIIAYFSYLVIVFLDECERKEIFYDHLEIGKQKMNPWPSLCRKWLSTFLYFGRMNWFNGFLDFDISWYSSSFSTWKREKHNTFRKIAHGKCRRVDNIFHYDILHCENEGTSSTGASVSTVITLNHPCMIVRRNHL